MIIPISFVQSGGNHTQPQSLWRRNKHFHIRESTTSITNFLFENSFVGENLIRKTYFQKDVASNKIKELKNQKNENGN